MRLKEKNLLKKFAATLKKFSAQGAKKVEYGILVVIVDVQIDRLLTVIKVLMIRILEISIFISCDYIKFREMLS